MDRKGRLEILRRLLKKIEELRSLNHLDPKFIEWHEEAKRQLKEFYADHKYVKQFEELKFQALIFRTPGRVYTSDLEFYQKALIEAGIIFKMLIQWEEGEERKEREEE